MQTFLPSRDFAVCAKFLDRQRLGKQRVEALQIANALISERLTYDPRGYHLKVKKGWLHHPAVKMWKGIEMKAEDFVKEFDEEFDFPSKFSPWKSIESHEPPFKKAELRQMAKEGIIVLDEKTWKYRLTLKAAALRGL